MNNDPIYVERRKGWLNELRTTTIPQTRGVLHRVVRGDDGEPVGMCCLGVGSYYAMEHGCNVRVFLELAEDNEVMRFEGEGMFNSQATMIQDVQNWFGFDLGHDEICDSDGTQAWRLNDNRGMSFAEIADALEPAFVPEDQR